MSGLTAEEFTRALIDIMQMMVANQCTELTHFRGDVGKWITARWRKSFLFAFAKHIEHFNIYLKHCK